MKAGIFYGSTTGNTANIAEEIAKAMGIGAADIHDVSKASPDDAKAYDTLILAQGQEGGCFRLRRLVLIPRHFLRRAQDNQRRRFGRGLRDGRRLRARRI